MLRIMPKPFVLNNRKHENPRKAFNRIGLEWGGSFHKNRSQGKKQTFVRKEQNLLADFYVWDKKKWFCLFVFVVLGSSGNSSFDSRGNSNLSDKSVAFLLKVCAFPPALLHLGHGVVEAVLRPSLQRSGFWLCLVQLPQRISHVILERLLSSSRCQTFQTWTCHHDMLFVPLSLCPG